MRVLLTGPTGSVGVQILKEFERNDRKFELRVFEKETELARTILEPYKDKIDVFYGDLRDRSTLKKATENVDYVIHTAAIIPPLADHDTELAYEVNVTGTENLLKEVRQNSPNAFFLYTSSVSVYGDRLLSDGIKVGDALKPSLGDYYAETKIAAEDLVKASGLRFSIFRLSGVMGPRPGEDRSKIDPLMFHMPLATKYELVTTRDCAYALVKSIDHQSELEGNIYNLSGGKNCRVIYRDFLKHNFEISGIDIEKFPKYAFAEQNFHCAFYADADILNDILNFQRDSLESYYAWTDPKPKPLQRFFVKLFHKRVVESITRKSDVLKAVKDKDQDLIKRFFRNSPI